MNLNDHSSNSRKKSRLTGLLAGPLAACSLYFLLPQNYGAIDGNLVEFTHAGRATLAGMVWMAIWWLTEAIDIAATALLPLVIFPFCGISTIDKTAAPYGSDIIFLFMGGFIFGSGDATVGA